MPATANEVSDKLAKPILCLCIIIEKIMPVFSHRREFELVSHTLITGYRDAVYGFMPPLGGGLWRFPSNQILSMVGRHVFVCCLAFFY